MTPAGDAISRFEFATATRIVFGAGCVKEVGSLAREYGRRALVVTGGTPQRASPLLDVLTAAGVKAETFPVAGEPTPRHIAAGVALARLKGHEVILGFGGGSAIDAAKAIAGLLTNDGDLFDYLEVIGRALPLIRPALPWIAIPTTAGAGAEVTRNAVITSREHRVKASLRSLHLLARAAFVDPELTLKLPPAVTAATGLDALTQVIEPFVCRRANPLIDGVCREGVRRLARSLRTVVASGHDLGARTDVAYGALCGGLALANAGLGVVHGLAAPLGGAYVAPHGAVCAALLPHAMALNVRALRAREPGSPALIRYALLARDLTGRDDASLEDGLAWVGELVRDLEIPPLRAYGLTPAEFGVVADQAGSASSMKANPVALERQEVISLLEAAW